MYYIVSEILFSFKSLLIFKVLLVKVIVTQSCLTLCDPMDCSLPGSYVHGILQTRILEWVAIPFFGGIFPIQGLKLGLLHWQADSLQSKPPGKPTVLLKDHQFLEYPSFGLSNPHCLLLHIPIEIISPFSELWKLVSITLFIIIYEFRVIYKHFSPAMLVCNCLDAGISAHWEST